MPARECYGTATMDHGKCSAAPVPLDDLNSYSWEVVLVELLGVSGTGNLDGFHFLTNLLRQGHST